VHVCFGGSHIGGAVRVQAKRGGKKKSSVILESGLAKNVTDVVQNN